MEEKERDRERGREGKLERGKEKERDMWERERERESWTGSGWMGRVCVRSKEERHLWLTGLSMWFPFASFSSVNSFIQRSGEPSLALVLWVSGCERVPQGDAHTLRFAHISTHTLIRTHYTYTRHHTRTQAFNITMKMSHTRPSPSLYCLCIFSFLFPWDRASSWMTGTYSTHSASHISKSPTVFYFESCHLISMFTFLNSRESSPYPLLFLMSFHLISLTHTRALHLHFLLSPSPHSLFSSAFRAIIREVKQLNGGSAMCGRTQVCVCMCMHIKRERERERDEKNWIYMEIKRKEKKREGADRQRKRSNVHSQRQSACDCEWSHF